MENLVVFSEDGVELEVSVTPEQETVWLIQAQMAKLFDTTPQRRYYFYRLSGKV